MTEATLSSSPTRHLTSWWKTFKQREDGSPSPAGVLPLGNPLGKLTRPHFPHMSQSSSAIPQSRASTATIVTNQGREVAIPGEYETSPIFGVPLAVSTTYASVKISLTDRQGNSFVYGHVPVVVAKCALYLKQQARDVDGIFRVSGSIRRIRMLQDLFNTAPRFGKDLDWQGFSVHDAANILRRFLNNLPEPIIPLDRYDQFREPLAQATGLRTYMEAQAAALTPGTAESSVEPELTDADRESIGDLIKAYQQLIFALPPISLQLLVYLLDLLSVFAAHSEQNRMPAFNLSAIFQPSILSHPEHDMAPDEYKLSRLVVEFLITNSAPVLRQVELLALAEHEAAAGSSTTSSASSAAPAAAAASAASAGPEGPAGPADASLSSVSSASSASNGSLPASAPPAPIYPPESSASSARKASGGSAVASQAGPGSAGHISHSHGADSSSHGSSSHSSHGASHGHAIPTLNIQTADDDPIQLHSSSSHQRRHSKSLSSAQPPRLYNKNPMSPLGHLGAQLRRQVSSTRRRDSSASHASHASAAASDQLYGGNDSSTSLATSRTNSNSIMSGDDDDDRARRRHDGDTRSRWRRSLMMLRPQEEDPQDGSSSRGTSPSRNWLLRKLNKDEQ